MSNYALRWVWSISLPPGEKLVLARLADMANAENECFPKQETLAIDTGLSRTSISRHMKNLEKKRGLVKQIRQRHKDGRMRASKYKLIIDQPCVDLQQGNLSHCKAEQHHVSNWNSINPHIDPSSKDICEVSVETPFPCTDKSQELDRADGNRSKSSKKSHNSSDSDGHSINELFGYWKRIMKHPRAKLDAKRRRIIHAALRLYPLELLKQAIDGCANTPFNMGMNPDKKKYDSIGLILRGADQIERFIQNASANKTSSILNSALSQADQLAMGAI